MAAPIEIAFEKFEADLKEAVTLMCSDSRETAKVAVKAALEFVHAHKELAALNLHRPFYTLLAALDGLEEGRVAPLLKPVQVDHRPPDSVVKQEAQAYACFCVDLLMSLGDPIEGACKAVANILVEHGMPFGGWHRAPRWRTIKHWRDEVSKLSADHPRRAILEQLREGAAEKRREFVHEDRREYVLALLNQSLKFMGGRAALE